MMATTKKDAETRKTTKLSVRYSHKICPPNTYNSQEASLQIEFDTDISADCTEELSRRVFEAYQFVRQQVERQVCEHSETFTTASNALEAAKTLEQLEKYATRIDERITDGSIHEWEVAELQQRLNERRTMLTDYTKELEPPAPNEPAKEQKQLLEGAA